jgi:hypothetical protein
MTTSQAAGTKLSVNVLDYGAVPDGATDCSAAFQRAIDDLDPRLGGTVLIPAASNWYQFGRSVVVDRDNIRFVGENPTTTVLETRAAITPLIFGLQRGKRTRPLSAAHWEDLSGILDTTAAPAVSKLLRQRTRQSAGLHRMRSAATCQHPDPGRTALRELPPLENSDLRHLQPPRARVHIRDHRQTLVPSLQTAVDHLRRLR